MNKWPLILSILLTVCSVYAKETYQYPEANEKVNTPAHLFILSGQSNMAALDPAISFTPAIIKAYGSDKAIVIKDAKGGQSIQRWYRKWLSVQGKPSKFKGDLYDRLINTVKASIKDREILSVTFIWMQGENDAATNQVAVYEKSLKGLFKQLEIDLGRKDINFVLGRLSDYSLDSGKHPQWQQIRELQVKFAEASPRGAWVDCDDLNNKTRNDKPYNDVHYTRDGYKIFGERLAEKSIQLINKNFEQALSLKDSEEQTFPGKKTDFHGFDCYQFRTKTGVAIKVIAPKKAAPGKPWLWRSLFWEAIPLFRDTDLKLVSEGYHVVLAHGDVAGHPSGNKNIDAAYKLITEEYGFSKKCSMASMSRGTLSLFRWASTNPEKVESIYVDNGVCNVLSWPAGKLILGNKSIASGAPASWEDFKRKFGYATDEEALKTKESPIDQLEPLAKAGVPILMVCGNNDKAVPYEENDAIMEERYKKLGGSIIVIVENKGHSHGMKDPRPVLKFIRKHTEKTAK